MKDYNFRADEPQSIKTYHDILIKKEFSHANFFVQ